MFGDVDLAVTDAFSGGIHLLIVDFIVISCLILFV